MSAEFLSKKVNDLQLLGEGEDEDIDYYYILS